MCSNIATHFFHKPVWYNFNCFIIFGLITSSFFAYFYISLALVTLTVSINILGLVSFCRLHKMKGMMPNVRLRCGLATIYGINLVIMDFSITIFIFIFDEF